MTVERTIIPRTYHDSVTLMRVSEEIGEEYGLEDSYAVIDTEANMEVLLNAGLIEQDASTQFQPGDLILVAQGPSTTRVEGALAEMESRLRSRTPSSRTSSDETIQSDIPRRVAKAAMTLDGGTGFALISVPSEYAVREAWHALHHDLHVHVFSDGVDVETAEDVVAGRRRVESSTEQPAYGFQYSFAPRSLGGYDVCDGHCEPVDIVTPVEGLPDGSLTRVHQTCPCVRT